MNLTKKRAVLVPLGLLLSACATVTSPPSATTSDAPRPAATPSPAKAAEHNALHTLFSQQDRLYRVAAPLLVNNSDLCRKHARNLLGFTAKNKYSYSADLTTAAQNAFGLDDRLQVMGVLAGSGAAKAGVRRGDKLIAVEDKPLPHGQNAERQAANLLAPIVTGRSNVKLSLIRDGANLSVSVPLTYACAFGIELGNTDNVNAYSDGHRILVTRGMLNATKSDEELAYVLAKEMAHNALGHASKQKMSATVGGIIDNLTRANPDMSTMVGLSGVKPMPPQLDAMADKLSLYMLARAGYNIDQAAPFWQRMANQYPATMLNAYTALHPATAQRVVAMEKAVADIKSKQAAKKKLMP